MLLEISFDVRDPGILIKNMYTDTKTNKKTTQHCETYIYLAPLRTLKY